MFAKGKMNMTLSDVFCTKMFTRICLGATGDHVETSMYPPAWEDFADSTASNLDTWVFDSVEVTCRYLNRSPLLVLYSSLGRVNLKISVYFL